MILLSNRKQNDEIEIRNLQIQNLTIIYQTYSTFVWYTRDTLNKKLKNEKGN